MDLQGKSEDLCLVLNKDYTGLFKKYERLVCSCFSSYNLRCPQEEKLEFNDYYAFAYEQCVAAASKVNPEKIKKSNLSTWGFHYQYTGYLRSYASLNMKKMFKRRSNEQKIEGEAWLTIPSSKESSMDLSFSKKEFWRAFEEAYKYLTPTQQKIWDLKLKDETMSSIIETLNLKNTYQYKKELEASELIFKRELNKKNLSFDMFLG